MKRYAVGLCLGLAMTLATPALVVGDPAAWEACKSYHADRAVAACSRIIEAAAEAPRALAVAHTNRGAAYQDLKQRHEALADYNTAIRLDPGSAKAHFNRALLYGDLERLEAAYADLSSAIALDPSYAKAYARRGLARIGAEPGAAIDDLAKALELEPGLQLEATPHKERWGEPKVTTSVEKLTKAAEALAGADGDPERAFKAYEIALTMAPQTTDLMRAKAALEYNLGRLDASIATLSAAIDINAKDGRLWAQRCLSRIVKRDLVNAGTDCVQASQITENRDAYALEVTGLLLHETGRHADAVAYLTQAIKLQPVALAAFVYRGLAFQKLGKAREATADFEKAATLEPRHPRDQQAKADAEVKLGRAPPAPPAPPPAAPPPTAPVASPPPAASAKRADAPARASASATATATAPAGFGAGERFGTGPGRLVYHGLAAEGADIGRSKEASIVACAAKCEGQTGCAAFSFDGWNGWCFLKSSATCLRRDPRYATVAAEAVRMRFSNQALAVDRRQGRAYPGSGYRTVEAASFDACAEACRDDERCEGLNFRAADKSCSLMARPGEYQPVAGSDVGIKSQRPSPDCQG